MKYIFGGVIVLIISVCTPKEAPDQSDAISIPSPQFYVPSTISQEAQAIARTFTHESRNEEFPLPDDVEGWKNYWEDNEDIWKAENDRAAEKFGVSVESMELGGVPALDIKPKNWKDNGKVLVYTHGGGYTLFSARSSLVSSGPMADATGLRVISIDYTTPPRAKWMEVTGQIVSVIQALLGQGYELKDIAIYGDSAGGGLAAGSTLRLRDEGVGLLAAVVLWSPWSDITETGDTYQTNKETSPLLIYEKNLAYCADAYADPCEQKHPYVSPVYGDYSKGYPPTLIQVGTKELFLSNAVRLYRALDDADIIVRIDPYEGMWHGFQAFHWDIPESYHSRKNVTVFLKEHLGY